MMAARLARLRLDCKRAYGSRGFNPAYMAQTLQERMVELMTATGWTVGEIASIAGVTSAAVSQWIGNGRGKQSKSIGNMEAAVKLEKASGFSWLWLAKGKGPKLASTPETSVEEVAREIRLEDALAVLTKALQKADKNARIALEPLLASMAKEPEDAGQKSQLILKLLVTSEDRPGETHHEPRSPNKLGTLIGGSVSQDILGGQENGRSDRDAGKRSAQR